MDNFNETLACQQDIERLSEVNRAIVYIDTVVLHTRYLDQ